MPMQVCMGATMMCTFGMAPSNLVVLPPPKMTMTSQQPDANIMDHVPMVNIMPFGMCFSLANPMVAAATGIPAATILMQWSQSGPNPCASRTAAHLINPPS